jgi:hypothetical protein
MLGRGRYALSKRKPVRLPRSDAVESRTGIYEASYVLSGIAVSDPRGTRVIASTAVEESDHPSELPLSELDTETVPLTTRVARPPTPAETTGKLLYKSVLGLNVQLSRANRQVDATALVLSYLPIGTPVRETRAILRAMGCQIGQSANRRRLFAYAMCQLPVEYLEQRYLIVDLIWGYAGTRAVVSELRAELQNRVSSDL